jgi:hypothetical protein
LQDGIGRGWYIMQRAGVEFFVFSKEDTKAMEALSEPLADEWAAEQDGKGLAGKKVMDFFLKRVRYWEKH